jgi:dethiobiotin synthetase
MNFSKQLFISGISTDVGKTVVSAILAEALGATYWKPIQAGDLENSDSIKVRNYCSEKVEILPEQFRLSLPMSPHAAAEIDGIKIFLNDFIIPQVEVNLIIEGAGGVMVPINSEGDLIIDLVKKENWPVLLVSRHILGSINHTLLSIEVLQKRNISIAGIIFVGHENQATESIIALKSGVEIWGRIPLTNEITNEFIKDQASQWEQNKFLQNFITKIL